MTASPAHTKWPLPLPEDDGYETPDSTIDIHVEGPEETEVAMQVSVDGVTADGSHAELYSLQEGPLNPLFDDNAHHLVNWDRHSLGIWDRSASPASSPPCSPPPSSGSNTPESGYLSWEFLSSPEIAHGFQEQEGQELNLENRLFEREQHIPGLLLQETAVDITSLRVFSEEELRSLNWSSIVDQNSPSPQALSPDIPLLTPPSGSISEPAPSTSNRQKRRHTRRRSERVLPPENPPFTRRSLRSARRASSSSPYPSPHSSPSSREPILPQTYSPPNSTFQSMDDNRAVDQAVYRHASTSASSLAPSPRGSHASPHTANYPPEHRPQSPSLVHRTLAREGRKKSRSISPFDNGSGIHHGHRPRSSSRTRPDVFAQNVPTYLTKNKNVGGSGVGASSSSPSGSSPAILQKSYPLRMASFETGRQQQPVVQAGGVQRPSSLVRTSYMPDDDMTSSSNEDAEMDDEANQQGHEGARGRRRSVSSSSSSDSSLIPQLPPKSSSAARRISAGSEKGKIAQGFEEPGADGMPIDSRTCEPEAPDTDDPESEDEPDAEEYYRPSSDLASQRRSSYPSVHHYPSSSNYGSPTGYPSTFGPSPHVPSSLREEVPRSRIQSRTRSQSHSPSRHDRSRSLSRARYSPMATRVVPTSPNESRPTSRPRPPAEAHPVRRSTRLSKSPGRQSGASVGEPDHVSERQADQHYLHCCCGYTAQNRTHLDGHLRKNAGACRELLHQDGSPQQARTSNTYPTQRRRDFETEEEDSAASEFDGDEDDDDYCETGSQRGRRTKKRASPSRPSYNYHGGSLPLQGSPLKRSAVLLSPSSPVSDSKLPIGQPLPSPRSYPTHSRSASDSSVRGRPSTYHNTVTRGSPSSRSPNTNSTPLQAVAYSAERANDANNGTTAPVGGTIVSGVGAMSPNRNQYRSVGSRNIDNASEKRRKGEKRFKCKFEDCGKMFTTNQNCQIHERKHIGDAPYRCGCGYAVAGRSDLVRHLRKKNVNPECRELPREDHRRVDVM